MQVITRNISSCLWALFWWKICKGSSHRLRRTLAVPCRYLGMRSSVAPPIHPRRPAGAQVQERTPEWAEEAHRVWQVQPSGKGAKVGALICPMNQPTSWGTDNVSEGVRKASHSSVSQQWVHLWAGNHCEEVGLSPARDFLNDHFECTSIIHLKGGKVKYYFPQSLGMWNLWHFWTILWKVWALFCLQGNVLIEKHKSTGTWDRRSLPGSRLGVKSNSI